MIATTEAKPARKVSNSKTELSESTKRINNKIVSELDPKVSPACSLCGTTFCNKYLLKRHLQNVHATEKKFKCDTCDRTFASSVYLNAHKRYHSTRRLLQFNAVFLVGTTLAIGPTYVLSVARVL